MFPISAVGGVGGDWGISPIGGLGGQAQVQGASSPSKSGGFGGALEKAIGSLSAAQNNADSAAQGLATGQITDPTQAVTTVQNAQLAMQFASQLSSKVVQDVQTIFQTQV